MPDLVVLDWMLPQLSGIEVCRRLRGAAGDQQLPIIMLTARGEESDRVRGLATGADDYLVKPFSMPELLARVTGLLRRASPERLATTCSAYGDIELDRDDTPRRALRRGRSISARPNTACWSSFSSIRAGCSAASSCSTASGAGRLCRRAHGRRACRAPAQVAQLGRRAAIRSAPCALPATPSMTGLRRRSSKASERTSRLRRSAGRSRRVRRRPKALARSSRTRGPYPICMWRGLQRPRDITTVHRLGEPRGPCVRRDDACLAQIRSLALSARLGDLAPAIGGRLIGDARVMRAIGQAGERLAAAEEEVRGSRDRRPASGRWPR